MHTDRCTCRTFRPSWAAARPPLDQAPAPVELGRFRPRRPTRPAQLPHRREGEGGGAGDPDRPALLSQPAAGCARRQCPESAAPPAGDQASRRPLGPGINPALSRENPNYTDVVSDDYAQIYLQYSTQWMRCRTWAATDVDGDGIDELVYYNGFQAGVDILRRRTCPSSTASRAPGRWAWSAWPSRPSRGGACCSICAGISATATRWCRAACSSR